MKEKMSQDPLKNKIVAGIEKAKEKGFTLVSEGWGNTEHPCACALGCLIVANDKTIDADESVNTEVAASLLSVSEGWVNSFTSGFDGHSPDDFDFVDKAYALGTELRKEYEPVALVDDYIN